MVRHIEPVREKKLFNNRALELLAADVVHAKSELQGEGEVVAICDTGFDLGSTSNVHPAFQGRVAKIYALGRNTGSDPEGHGTHVCGSAAGDGTSSVLGEIRGTAPKATLVVQSVLDSQGGLGGLPADLRDLFEVPYGSDGARVHSNSWGDSRNAYTEEAREVDDFVWQHRDAVIVFAAGNDGSDGNGNGLVDAGSVGSPGTAKNCITVGASENDRPDFRYTGDGANIGSYGDAWPNDFPVDPIRSDGFADNPHGLAAFSSRGPTSDGRIKPDVVAPGTAILSTRSRAVGVGEGWGLSADPLFFYEGGTSMATPLVAGCAAVVRQYLRKQGNAPSAALVKAVLINTARDLSGQYPGEARSLPNVNEGFGRVDLAAGVAAASDARVFEFWDEATALDTGEEQSFSVALAQKASQLKVTLVWTDSPGETLQNDLDLIVISPSGAERHGNMGTSKKFDRKNNVEQVVLHGVGPGTVKITVRAFRAATAAQSFALVFSAEQ
jgi:serine protease AprX